MHFFSEMIKNDVDMSCYKKTFRDIEFILLFKKPDVVTMLRKFIAQISKSTCRKRKIREFSFKLLILLSDIQKRIKNIDFFFVAQRVQAFLLA